MNDAPHAHMNDASIDERNALGLSSHALHAGESRVLSRRRFVTMAASAAVVASPAVLLQNALLSTKTAYADPLIEKLQEARAILARVDELQVTIDSATADYNAAMIEWQAAVDQLNECQSRIDEKNREIAEYQEKLGDRARSMYKTGSASVIDLLLGATSFTAFTNNWSLLNNMNEADAKDIQHVKDLRADIVAEKNTYEEHERLCATAVDTAAETGAQAQHALEEMTQTFSNLSSDILDLIDQEQAARDEWQRQEVLAWIASGTPGAGTSGGQPAPNLIINNEKPQTVDGALVIHRAVGEIGKPYLWGACGPTSFDCSGLVSYCLCGEYGRRLGTTHTFYYWDRVTTPLPGDICTNWGHCGIYIGDGLMIHAPNSNESVKIGPVKPGMIFVRY